jgi:cytochrome c oxidase assembly protein subunit 15
MSWFRRINLVALILCFIVVVFGAYVRLSNAGLGCPDWPGCYGQITVPAAPHEVAQAQESFPQRPVEAPKAWKEMIHRYLATTLGTLLVVLAALAWTGRGPDGARALTLGLVGTVCVQGALGALTVLWQVNPLTVTGHLLVGLTTLALLWWLWLHSTRAARLAGQRELHNEREAWGSLQRAALNASPAGLRLLAPLALLLLGAQIFLGGWTSTNYAAAACPDFPTCQGSLWPKTDFEQAFTLWRGLGINYEYGVLDNAGRVTIHLMHRCGAAIVGIVLGGLALYLLLAGRTPQWRRLGAVLAAALVLQITIGVSLVLLHFPLWLGDAHNAGAAILLLTVLALNFFAWRPGE